MAFFPGHPG